MRDPLEAKEPTDPVYQEILDEIAAEEGREEAAAKFRAACERDFWFFCRFASSFGRFAISDRSHRRYGHLWVDEPWIFERCRDIQAAYERGESGIFWNWPRFHFKTTLITTLVSCWLTLKNPMTTVAILTYKVDQTGEAMFQGVRDELERNEAIREHWSDRLTKRALRSFTKSSLTLERPPGPKEPSISIHSLDNMPTSLHVDVVLIDDAEVREVVRSQTTIATTTEALSQITFLGKDDTIFWTIGTIWDANGPYMKRIQEGRFRRRDHRTPYEDDGKTPVLRSVRMLEEWKAQATDYDWSCQMLGIPIAKDRQVFDVLWLVEYQVRPADEARGKWIYFIVDPAGGRGEKREEGDFSVIYVPGFGSDKKQVALDLHRERYSLNEWIDLLFQLHAFWSTRGVFQAAFIEEFGAAGYVDAVKKEQEHRGYRFRVQSIPQTKRPKAERIEYAQPFFRRGEILWPAGGFGHGSRLPPDRRDTFQQFRDDEYKLWSPVPGATLFDDMIDAVAWTVQPELAPLLRGPEVSMPETDFPLGGFPREESPVSKWVLM